MTGKLLSRSITRTLPRQQIAYLKSRLPPGDPALKSFSDLCREQKSSLDQGNPQSNARERALELYEGFEEDVRRIATRPRAHRTTP